jgi:hypothetical protein
MRAKVIWIGIVVGLLSMSIIIYGVGIILAVTDPSFALEPEYEQKAAQFDEIRRQEEVNDRLGWMVDLQTSPTAMPGRVELRIEVFDKWGKPIRNAIVGVDAFFNARANDIYRRTLDEQADGTYTTTMPVRHAGLWEFRLTVDSGDERFTKTIRKSLATR